MNIFVVTNDYNANARILDDKRLNKMIVETAQILSTVIHLNGDIGPYKKTHENHPCVKWANNTINYSWLNEYFFCLTDEYKIRFKKTHKSSLLQSQFDTFQLRNNSFISQGVKFTNVSFFKEEIDVFNSYKKTLVIKWENDKKPPKWTNREIPNWYNEIKKQLFSIDYDYVS